MNKVKFEKKDLPLKSAGVSDWYNRVVLHAELADYGPAKGTMIFRPYGFGIWEQIQKVLDQLIKNHGVENAYFPLFIPESLLNKEKQHVEGFSPELAVVTIGGGEELTEKLIVRPTSEAIMYDAYARWINSWRDLPMLINQWNNVVRWEKRTYLFLRTTEFLWQEGHTAHATHDEALAMVKGAMEMYEQIYREYLAIPGYVGRKSETEKFAGADMTLGYEALMPEGKALQSCTSHDLGQNFAHAFNISFLDQKGTRQHVWQTSWGLSTRSIGALLMLHGDDQGLRLPPRIAPIQVVIVPIGTATMAAQEIGQTLKKAGIRTYVDTRDKESLGSKINKWELKGVPLRIEIGPREVTAGTATMVQRDTFEKTTVEIDNITEAVESKLAEIQSTLYQQAEAFLLENTHQTSSYEEFQEIMKSKRGFIRAPWCEEAACEAAIKAETKATTRCLPLDSKRVSAVCIKCGKPAQYEWYFAQAY